MSEKPARATTADTGLETFADAFGEFMRAARRARGRAQSSPSADGELTLSQYTLLDALLDADGPLTVRELAVGAGVASPTATRMLTGLEQDGLIARERPDAGGDRRCVMVRLTDEGRDRLAAKREHVAQWRRDLFDSLLPGEREQAARLLTRLAAAVDDL